MGQPSRNFLLAPPGLTVEPCLSLDAASAADFAAGFGDKTVAVHAGHGLFASGGTVDEAAWWFMCMEQCCHAQLLAEAAGTPQLWPHEMAAATGSPTFGWL